jgi:hypothetical protein
MTSLPVPVGDSLNLEKLVTEELDPTAGVLRLLAIGRSRDPDRILDGSI